MRTLRVTGKGRLTLRPDLTRVVVTVSDVCADYAVAMRQSAERTGELRERLSALGFAPDELKTLELRTDAEHEGYEENGVWKNRFVGYRYTHRMKLEFACDGQKLGAVLSALSGCRARPEFSVLYTLKDPEAAKDTLLRLAVEDARRQAGVLAAAAEVTLKEIAEINCAWNELRLETAPMTFARLGKAEINGAADAASFDPGAAPDDIPAEETVTVLWEIA